MPGHDEGGSHDYRGSGSALPLPLQERVGVRGLLSFERYPSPDRYAVDLSRKGRGEERAGCLTFEYERPRGYPSAHQRIDTSTQPSLVCNLY